MTDYTYFFEVFGVESFQNTKVFQMNFGNISEDSYE